MGYIVPPPPLRPPNFDETSKALKCESCGAGHKPNSGRCEYCGSYFKSGGYFRTPVSFAGSGTFLTSEAQAFADYIRPQIEQLTQQGRTISTQYS